MLQANSNCVAGQQYLCCRPTLTVLYANSNCVAATIISVLVLFVSYGKQSSYHSILNRKYNEDTSLAIASLRNVCRSVIITWPILRNALFIIEQVVHSDVSGYINSYTFSFKQCCWNEGAIYRALIGQGFLNNDGSL